MEGIMKKENKKPKKQRIGLIKLGYIMKNILRSRDKDGVLITGDLINAVLSYYKYPNLEILGFCDAESISLAEDTRSCIAYFIAKDPEEEYHVVEVEVESGFDYQFFDKALCNTSETILGSHEAEHDFCIKKVFHITVLFSGIEEKCPPVESCEQLEDLGIISRCEYCFLDRDKRALEAGLHRIIPKNYKKQSTTMFFIDVNKFVLNGDHDTTRRLDGIEQWLYMFNYGKTKDYFPNPLREAVGKWQMLAMTDREKQEYIRYVKFSVSMRRKVEFIEQEAWEEAEKREEQTIRALHNRGMHTDEIAKIVERPVDYVVNILSEVEI